MGFFSKLFGGNKEAKPDPAADTPVKKQIMKGSAFLILRIPRRKESWIACASSAIPISKEDWMMKIWKNMRLPSSTLNTKQKSSM